MTEDGFRIQAGVLAPAECAALIRALGEVPRSRAGARHLLAVPEVAALARDPRLVGIAREFLRADPFPFRATLFDKSSDSNWLVVWHQDTALPLKQRLEEPGWGPWSTKGGVIYAHAPAWALARVIALRVHLDASGSSNGPLRVIPSSHEMGVLTDDQVASLSGSNESRVCVVPAGGVLAMRPLLVHSSSKSTGDSPRRVIHIEYSDAGSLAPGRELAVA